MTKLFAIYDLNIMPYSIGDIISFVAAVQVQRFRNNIRGYDICFIANCGDRTDNIFNNLVHDHNKLHYYLKLIDALQINNAIESIYYCSDYQEFHQLYTLKKNSCLVWPELEAIQAREYLHYRIYPELHEFKLEFGFLPNIFNSSPLTKWAHSFFATQVEGLVPVTINLRINVLFSDHRNARVESWLDFISHCRGRYPVKFILICSRSEIDGRFYSHPNVLLAKDRYTSIAQDIALIAHAPLHLGSASGPATISPFVTHPSLITNCDMAQYMEQYRGALQFYRDDRHVRFSFSNENQYYSTFPETAEYLIQEFDQLWNAIDVNEWQKTSRYWLNMESSASHSWLD